MKARMVIPTAAGDVVSYELVTGDGRIRIVLDTSEERFERWLFYLFRDLGGHVVTDDVGKFRSAMGLGSGEAGVVDEHDVEQPLLNRHPATA